MSYTFTKDERYKNIVEKYVNAMERKENQLKADVRTERIRKEAEEKMKEITEDLKKYYDDRMSEISKGKKEIVKSYKERGREYKNPQAEILRRQDFEMELAVADDHELKEIAGDMDRKLSRYEINKLQLEFRERNLSSADLTRQRIDVKEAHETDPNYQALASEEIEMFHLKPKVRAADNWILTPSKEESERPTFSPLGALVKYERNPQQIKELKSGFEELKKEIKSNATRSASFNPAAISEAEDIAEQLIDSGKAKNLKEYQDDDLRAIKGSKDYTLEDEYRYLKERYADPTNKMYTWENPNYSVEMHIKYLREQHKKNLSNTPELKTKIENALKQSQEKDKEVNEADNTKADESGTVEE